MGFLVRCGLEVKAKSNNCCTRVSMSNRCLDVTALWYNILSSLGVNYLALTDGASCFKAEACPKGRGLSSTGTKGRSDPDLLRMLREAL